MISITRLCSTSYFVENKINQMVLEKTVLVNILICLHWFKTFHVMWTCLGDSIYQGSAAIPSAAHLKGDEQSAEAILTYTINSGP